jgi:1,4-dihydroxy-2-naphthoyl-CoA hydrolase
VPDDDEWLRAVAEAQPAYAGFLGLRLTSFSRDLVEAELTVRPELANRNGVLHGGALMGFADNLAGTAASLNLPRGARTTTVESKTNFFRAVQVGSTARARCLPLHRGRTTSVWQTTVSTEDGRTAAIVTQTQLVLHPPSSTAP